MKSAEDWFEQACAEGQLEVTYDGIGIGHVEADHPTLIGIIRRIQADAITNGVAPAMPVLATSIGCTGRLVHDEFTYCPVHDK